MYCEIYVNGYVPADWSDWLGGLKITNLSSGDAILTGELTDQTALFGVLNHIHNLNLSLVTLTTSKLPPTQLQAHEPPTKTIV